MTVTYGCPKLDVAMFLDWISHMRMEMCPCMRRRDMKGRNVATSLYGFPNTMWILNNVHQQFCPEILHVAHWHGKCVLEVVTYAYIACISFHAPEAYK